MNPPAPLNDAILTDIGQAIITLNGLLIVNIDYNQPETYINIKQQLTDICELERWNEVLMILIRDTILRIELNVVNQSQITKDAFYKLFRHVRKCSSTKFWNGYVYFNILPAPSHVTMFGNFMMGTAFNMRDRLYPDFYMFAIEVNDEINPM